jgi:hypothetical protein|tara:strand:+ start:81 stop:248 length:168 start_codon:yes stop_codon:yes gene_type:complete
MTKLELFLIEFGAWWKTAEEPTVQKFCAYKVEQNELEDLVANQNKLLAIEKILNG